MHMPDERTEKFVCTPYLHRGIWEAGLHLDYSGLLTYTRRRLLLASKLLSLHPYHHIGVVESV